MKRRRRGMQHDLPGSSGSNRVSFHQRHSSPSFSAIAMGSPNWAPLLCCFLSVESSGCFSILFPVLLEASFLFVFFFFFKCVFMCYNLLGLLVWVGFISLVYFLLSVCLCLFGLICFHDHWVSLFFGFLNFVRVPFVFWMFMHVLTKEEKIMHVNEKRKKKVFIYIYIKIENKKKVWILLSYSLVDST